MAIIPQKQLFGWQEVDELGDLQRLLLVLNYLPDEELMKKLEQERGRGRDDYPIRAVWNSILAVYELPVNFSVTKASASDVKEGHKLVDGMAEQQP